MPTYLQIVEQIKSQWLRDAAARPGQKLPTQKELGAQFGVSRSTIVRSLAKLASDGLIESKQGGGIYIAEPPRDSGRTFISLIVPNLYAPVVMAACRGVERRARQLGYQVLLASSEFSLPQEQELVEQHLQSGTKGIVLYPATRRRHELANDYMLRWRERTPIVALDIACEEWPCSRVLFDNFRLGYEMTWQLIRHGRRHIAFMHTMADYLHNSIHDREKGWQMAMAEAGLEIPSAYIGWPTAIEEFSGQQSSRNMEAVLESLLTLEPRPDAVIAWTDDVASYFIRELLHRGLQVGEELRIAGFDSDPQISRLLLPPFPTSKPDFVRLGEIAVDVLMAEGNSPRRTCYYYPVPVVWRDTRLDPVHEMAARTQEEAIIGG